jgi:hypothetical protein
MLASMMQLGAERRLSLCCHPSLVAIASSNEALNFWAGENSSKLKRPKLKKVTKILGLQIWNTIKR